MSPIPRLSKDFFFPPLHVLMCVCTTVSPRAPAHIATNVFCRWPFLGQSAQLNTVKLRHRGRRPKRKPVNDIRFRIYNTYSSWNSKVKIQMQRGSWLCLDSEQLPLVVVLPPSACKCNRGACWISRGTSKRAGP